MKSRRSSESRGAIIDVMFRIQFENPQRSTLRIRSREFHHLENLRRAEPFRLGRRNTRRVSTGSRVQIQADHDAISTRSQVLINRSELVERVSGAQFLKRHDPYFF